MNRRVTVRRRVWRRRLEGRPGLPGRRSAAGREGAPGGRLAMGTGLTGRLPVLSLMAGGWLAGRRLRVRRRVERRRTVGGRWLVPAMRTGWRQRCWSVLERA